MPDEVGREAAREGFYVGAVLPGPLSQLSEQVVEHLSRERVGHAYAGRNPGTAAARDNGGDALKHRRLKAQQDELASPDRPSVDTESVREDAHVAARDVVLKTLPAPPHLRLKRPADGHRDQIGRAHV